MVSPQVTRVVGDKIWFGIGCFHFGYDKAIPYEFKRPEYLSELKTALEAVPAITDLLIEAPASEASFDELEVDEFPGSLEDGSGAFPHLGTCWIRFKIYIPTRVQAELANEFAPDSTGTENFIVFINYPYEGPVAFVVLDDPKAGDRDPSTAVRVVREFLRRELMPVDTPIRFECIGPSPFHADCSLTLIAAAPPRKGAFVVKRTPRRGYDLLEFTSDHPENDFAEEATVDLFHALGNELGFFYFVMGSEVMAARSWGNIQDEVNLLVKNSTNAGLWNWTVAGIRRSKKLHDVFTALINFDVARTFALNQRSEGYRDTYSADGGFLQPYVDRVLQDAMDYPTKQVTTLVGFLEKRRSKALELGVVLFAAIVGGIAGATLTNSSLLTRHSPGNGKPPDASSSPTTAVSPTPPGATPGPVLVATPGPALVPTPGP